MGNAAAAAAAAADDDDDDNKVGMKEGRKFSVDRRGATDDEPSLLKLGKNVV